MAKKAKLNDIAKCCESRFKHGLAADWKHGDFNDLSREILRETDVNISPNTLKRIFGKIAVDDDYLPQQATIEALGKYGGYIPLATEETESEPRQPVMASKPHMLKKYKTLLTISIIVMVVGALLSLKILKSRSKISGNITQTATEGLLPATVFFDMRLPYSSDSLFVNFGDKSPLVYVKQRQQKTAHNYLFPGVFDVNLQTRLNTVASTKVYVRSNKWIGLGYHRQRDLPDRYYAFPALKTGSDSLFHIPNNQLFKMGLDTAGSFFTRLCNFTPTGYASDNFVFETSFKNDLHEKGMYCHSTQFQISGMNSMIRFKLVSPGCSSQVLNVVSEQSFEGSTSNLSQFVVDLENWNTIKLINQNKHLTLLVNGKRVFEGSYQKSLGEIKGLFLEFEGNGFVKNCNLKSYDGETLYHF